jgi:hypothetical protein
MRRLFLALPLLAAPVAAFADPVQEARSATGACLAAVIDNAPVEDIDGDDVLIRRGKDPVSCTVRVNAGQPVLIRDAVMVAIKRRAELFVPAKTSWDGAGMASRETMCNLPGRRSLAVFVSTARPGQQPVLTATVFETAQRDPRCDKDLGLQTVAAMDPAAGPAGVAEGAPAPDAEHVAEIPAPPPKTRKPSLLRRIPGLRRD